MREIYRGNGFIITTNESNEIFLALESKPDQRLRVRANNGVPTITVSYLNTFIELVPVGTKTLAFNVFGMDE